MAHSKQAQKRIRTNEKARQANKIVRSAARSTFKKAVSSVYLKHSVCLNLGEGEHSDPGNRRARFDSAAASASDERTADVAARRS